MTVAPVTADSIQKRAVYPIEKTPGPLTLSVYETVALTTWATPPECLSTAYKHFIIADSDGDSTAKSAKYATKMGHRSPGTEEQNLCCRELTRTNANESPFTTKDTEDCTERLLGESKGNSKGLNHSTIAQPALVRRRRSFRHS